MNVNEHDHIKFDRGLFSHHAVVVDVYVDKNSYKVIHFTGEKRSGTPAEHRVINNSQFISDCIHSKKEPRYFYFSVVK
jgi:primosomal protein N''